MKHFFRLMSVGLMVAAAAFASLGQTVKTTSGASSKHTPISLKKSDLIQKIVDDAATRALEEFSSKGLKSENLKITVIDLATPANHVFGEFRGEERIYPASVVKFFYMVVLERWAEDGRIKETPELERGLKDMITQSSNDATQYIVDVLTGTSSGPEMKDKKAFERWSFKRNAMNRYFSALAYTNINVNQKTYCEDAYGIEQQFRNYKGQNRNALTANASARLMAEIVTGKTNNATRTERMMNLLSRDAFRTDGADEQATDFIGLALKERGLRDAKLYSKAGWTSKSRHDVAYVETGDGKKLVISIFTEGMANERNIIPLIAGYVIDNIGKNK